MQDSEKLNSTLTTGALSGWINGALITVFNMGSQAGRTVKAYEDRTVELIKKLGDKEKQLEEQNKIIFDLRSELSFKDSK